MDLFLGIILSCLNSSYYFLFTFVLEKVFEKGISLFLLNKNKTLQSDCKNIISWFVSNNTNIFSEFADTLMCSRTICSTSKESLLSPSFTGSPSTVTLYEVQLQLLQLDNFRSDAAFQGWLLPGRGDISLWREVGINLTCLKEQKAASATLEGFLFLYLYAFAFLFFLFLHISSFGLL